MIVETTYASYLAITIGMTIWVARTLSRNGLVFLVDAFEGRKDLASSVNHLLVVGFYLINLGYVSLALRFGTRPTDLVEAIEYLSTKVGLALIVLGAMHFFNMYVIANWGRNAARWTETKGRNGNAVAG